MAHKVAPLAYALNRPPRLWQGRACAQPGCPLPSAPTALLRCMHTACAACAPACHVCHVPLAALLTEVGVNCNANAATVPAALAKVVEAAHAANAARGDRQDVPDGGVRGDTAEDDGGDDDGDNDDDGGAIAADGESDGSMSDEEADDTSSSAADVMEAVPRSEEEGKAALDAFVQQCVVCLPCVLVPLVSVDGRNSRKPRAGRRPTLKHVRRHL